MTGRIPSMRTTTLPPDPLHNVPLDAAMTDDVIAFCGARAKDGAAFADRWMATCADCQRYLYFENQAIEATK